MNVYGAIVAIGAAFIASLIVGAGMAVYLDSRKHRPKSRRRRKK